MRKAQKAQAEEFAALLAEAHAEMKRNIAEGRIQNISELLEQCQQGAIELGTLIEKVEGEGFITVKLLEKYCEAVYELYQWIHQAKQGERTEDSVMLQVESCLKAVRKSIKRDIRIRKEVVFLPYKASMWDSLESVYLAAKADPDCDAYCIPIPYYDRNPDGTLGQMHYEGREYPKNIEIIDWKKYRLEERRPDVIYIHNPYDDCNLVTCVHPDYFSGNLKKYTEELIYIPYFVLQEIEPEDQLSIDTMKHFVWCPGVINADKVIVQSEKMKQIYVNEYLKAAKMCGLQGCHVDRNYLDKKFLGLGSPKLEKVKNTRKEDLEIPEEWLRMIRKPDGGKKKIVFYNNSISALLEKDEKMLVKMKAVFREFYESREEIVLLWRPHPLIKTTISAMRPHLWEEYEKIVNRYKAEGWGIYDDSSDLDRAIVLSDAYYGDSSSIVYLFLKLGKPTLIQEA